MPDSSRSDGKSESVTKDLGELNERYRSWLHTRHPECPDIMDAREVPAGATCVRVTRKGKSHRGIGDFSQLRELVASHVDQSFLDEICVLTGLTYLELDYPVTAANFGNLENLVNLEVLKIESPRNLVDFTPITRLPRLKSLFIANAKHMTSLDWLEPLRERLEILGVEGGMWTPQQIPSLAPLSGFDLEALFLTSTNIGDGSLAPLTSMRNLMFLGTARNAPRQEFEALQDALPQLACQWFDPAGWRD